LTGKIYAKKGTHPARAARSGPGLQRDPCRPNDRLLLRMKGSISEFELDELCALMLDAARAKAQRGELRISVSIGYIWHREIALGLNPTCLCRERSG
jgi:DNA invertase Pin-like site-specific DNA recombinase